MDFKVVYYVSVGVLVSCSFFFKQKTAYEMRISDWSSDVCSSDLVRMMAENAHARGESCSRTTSTRHCRASVSQYRRRGAAANGRGEPAIDCCNAAPREGCSRHLPTRRRAAPMPNPDLLRPRVAALR